jgi:outer membrane biosynthesis protein TonB
MRKIIFIVVALVLMFMAMPASAQEDPTNTPTDTPVFATNTATATPTSTPVLPTNTATSTPTNTPVIPTNTATSTPTNTPVIPTNTATSTPTETPVLPTNTATSTPTETPVLPTNTATSTPTETPVLPTNTATSTPTSTPVLPTNTATSTPTSTATNTPNAPTNTPTPTATPAPNLQTVFAKGSGATCFSEYGFSQWGWTNRITPGTYVWDLWAGAENCNTQNGTLVGTVTVVYSSQGTVTVTLNVDSPNILVESHVYAGSTALPRYRGRNTIVPGLYTNNSPFNKKPIYVIVNAIVDVRE